MVSATNDLKNAIRLAEQERDQLLRKLQPYEALKARVAQLETFINTGKSLYNLEELKTEQNQESTPETQPWNYNN